MFAIHIFPQKWSLQCCTITIYRYSGATKFEVAPLRLCLCFFILCCCWVVGHGAGGDITENLCSMSAQALTRSLSLWRESVRTSTVETVWGMIANQTIPFHLCCSSVSLPFLRSNILSLMFCNETMSMMLASHLALSIVSPPLFLFRVSSSSAS